MVSRGLETLFRKYKDMLYSIAVKMYILLYFSPITHSQTRHPHALSHRIYATHSPGQEEPASSHTKHHRFGSM